MENDFEFSIVQKRKVQLDVLSISVFVKVTKVTLRGSEKEDFHPISLITPPLVSRQAS